jgi:signal transduction histidine kinase
MADPYQVVAFILTALLLPGFGHLYLRFRDTRTLLWFLGFLFAMVRMLATYKMGMWDFSTGSHPWMAAAGQTSIQISSALFLASLSPARLRIGKFSVLYVIPFAIPLVVFSILLDGVFHGVAPTGRLFLVFPVLGLLSVVVGFLWGVENPSTPAWVGGGVCGTAGVFAVWLLIAHGPAWSLTSVESSTHLVTAILVICIFRRFSPGVFLSVLGFSAWSLNILGIVPTAGLDPSLAVNIGRMIVMAKVVAALGMILLALEDQLAINKAAEGRERRARLEMEAYSNLVLSRRRVEDFDRQATEICETVVKHSRFAQAALLLQNGGRFRLAGAAGFGDAVAKALDTLGSRIPAAVFLAPGSAPAAVAHSQTVKLDLDPWLEPGDDLKRLRFTSALAVPMVGRSSTEGTLLLAGMRADEQDHSLPLRAEDLLPVEMLTARLQSVRGQTMMLEKLIDSEKFSGLGQLAGNVTQQLNNPLTVILGYASLLEENTSLAPQERRGLEAILTEARRMRSTLESLSRVAYSKGDQFAAVSVAELLADLEELHRSEFLHRSIHFRISMAAALPRVLCNSQQLRQAVLHCLQFAMDAVDRLGPVQERSLSEERSITVEATAEGNRVQIQVAHSGPAFLHPERAFDPFVPAHANGETAGLGLSFCATILRDNNGSASAINLEPHGAAIILELQAA